MSETIQLIRYENNEKLDSDCLSDQNDHWNSNLSKNRSTCVFIESFSINDVAIFGCVIDKQYDTGPSRQGDSGEKVALWPATSP